MAVTFRGKNGLLNSTAGANTQVPMPAETVAGDLLLVVVGSILATSTITPPAGWAEIAQYAPVNNLRTAVYTKTAAAGDSAATYTWGWSGSARNFGYSLAYAGTDTAVAVTAQATYVQQDTADPVLSLAAGLTDSDWLVTVAVGRENPGTDTAKNWTNADSLDVERYDLYSTNASPAIKLSAAVWDSGRALPAGSAQRTVTPSPVMQLLHVWSIGVPAPDAPAPPAPTGDPWTYLGMPLR